MSESESLEHIALLSGLSDDARAALSRQCVWRTCRNGEEILNREDDSCDVLFITSGKVQVVDYSPSGREVAYAEVEAGGHVGELSAIDGLPRSAAIRALGECRMARLSGAAFMRLVAGEPSVAVALLLRLTRIIRAADDKITELSTVGAMQRVYRELQRLAQPDPSNEDGLIISNLPTQETMAARLGTTRETVARVLAQLAKARITQRRGRTLYVRDQEQLEALGYPDDAGY